MSFALRASQNPYKSIIQRALLFAGLTVLILVVLQPFGTYESDISYKYLKLCGYGLVTLCAMVVAGLVELTWGATQCFMRLEKTLTPLLYLFFNGVFNHAYFAVTVLGAWHWQNQLLFFFYVAAIGAFPVVFSYFVDRHAYQITDSLSTDSESMHVSTDNHKSSSEANKPSRLITLSGDNKNESLTVDIKNLVAIKAADNYCEITTLQQNEVTTTLLRISLNKLLEQCPENINLQRCHRSYAINIDAVISFIGNASGLTLTTTIDELTVPVSRAYVKGIKNALDSIS